MMLKGVVEKPACEFDVFGKFSPVAKPFVQFTSQAQCVTLARFRLSPVCKSSIMINLIQICLHPHFLVFNLFKLIK